ncbi:MAG: hypothetical protein CMD92_10090 [Gammaproteobacteria bacterium]|nr:hypothetical protein [Gammaproteobacteria bacterium]
MVSLTSSNIGEIAFMRYVVVSLLLVNLTYLGWNLGWPAPGSPTRESRPLLNTGLTLISEFESRTLGAELEASRLCSLVTGFQDDLEVADFMTAAIGLGLEVAYAVDTPNQERQYRVYLPPTPSAEIAGLTLQDLTVRLEDADVTAEIALVTRGDERNAITLGTFESATEAVSLRDRISILGYSPQIERIQPQPERLELWLRAPQSKRVDELEWLDLTGERSNLSRIENLCQTIAQATQFQ